MFRSSTLATTRAPTASGHGHEKKRPDIRFEMLTASGHDVIVEVDENQHRGYEESCEWPMAARISEIVGAIGGEVGRVRAL